MVYRGVFDNNGLQVTISPPTHLLRSARSQSDPSRCYHSLLQHLNELKSGDQLIIRSSPRLTIFSREPVFFLIVGKPRCLSLQNIRVFSDKTWDTNISVRSRASQGSFLFSDSSLSQTCGPPMRLLPSRDVLKTSGGNFPILLD
jgi:hypothetical protein